jgi:hypothetical protein
MSKNIIAQVKEAAKRHPDNVAVQSLVLQLTTAQAMSDGIDGAEEVFDPLIGYRAGTKGDSGYSTLYTYSSTPVDSVMKRMWAMHTVAVIADSLAGVLNALGEKFDY